MKFFLTCPKGIEQLAEAELVQLGAQSTRQTVAGVYAEGDLEFAYRVCLWSRLINRVLLVLLEAQAPTADDLYTQVQSINWLEHLRPSGSLLIDFTGRNQAINNTHFGALKVKDAIVDQIRTQTGARPDIERNQPDLRVNVHVQREQLTVAIDLSGDSLHRRGYRQQAGEAPMKENLAAAVLIRAGWNESDERVLLDPMCGSGTLLIEGAMMRADIAPGLYRRRFGFDRWPGHVSSVWKTLHDEAVSRRQTGLEQLDIKAIGFDADDKVLAKARENIRRAGLESFITVSQNRVEELKCPQGEQSGLVITNPPYGERLGDVQQLMSLYRDLGRQLKASFGGWKAAVFTANPDLGKVMKLRAEKVYKLFNGALPAQLLLFTVHEQTGEERVEEPALSEQAQGLENRLRKNLKQLSRWKKREQIEALRVYDADIPEYAVAVDDYAGRLIVQEYAPPAKVDKIKAFERLQEAVKVVARVYDCPVEAIVLKQRKRQSGKDQYERHDEQGHFFTINEHGCKLRVNLHDYLDTGLFLDHRPVRRRVQQLAKDRDLLNLFCYTGSVTVHAACGGARSTTSVDMSATYLDWARQNLELNGVEMKHHQLVQADCIRWLHQPVRQQFDVIFLDPPTFSNSKRMQNVLDVQRDHVDLVTTAMAHLRPGGVLIFSNNYRRFKLDPQLAERYQVEDITAATIDTDFKRNPRIHVCFEIRHKQ